MATNRGPVEVRFLSDILFILYPMTLPNSVTRKVTLIFFKTAPPLRAVSFFIFPARIPPLSNLVFAPYSQFILPANKQANTMINSKKNRQIQRFTGCLRQPNHYHNKSTTKNITTNHRILNNLSTFSIVKSSYTR